MKTILLKTGILLFAALLPMGCDKDKPEPTPIIPEISLPALSGISAVESGDTTVTSEITGNGGGAVTQYGHVYSESVNTPTLTESKTELGAVNGAYPFKYTSILKGVKPKTSYFVRPYATNSKGTAYGTTVQINTNAALPKISNEPDIVEVTETSIKITNSLSDNGGDIITEHGHILLLDSPGINTSIPTENPGLIKNKLGSFSGSLPHEFTCGFSKLKIGTRYAVWAYATNSKGTSYGNVKFIETAGSQDWSKLATTFKAPIGIDLAVSASDQVWMIGGANDSGDGNVYQLVTDKVNGTTEWKLKGEDIAFRSIAIAPDGTPWIINSRKGTFGKLTYYKNNKWEIAKIASGFGAIPNLIDISIGIDGSMWGVGLDETVTGADKWRTYRITKFTNGELSFESFANVKNPSRISVDPNGRPWVVTGDLKLFFFDGSNWINRSDGLLVWHVSAAADGTVWLVAKPTGTYVDTTYRLSADNSWEPVNSGFASGVYDVAAGKNRVYALSDKAVWSRSNAR